MSDLGQLVAAFCLAFGCATAEAPTEKVTGVPTKAQPYVQLIKSIAKNPSREAALTEQESNWNVRARSPYAKGLRQFTDSTGKWASKTFCRDLGTYRPYDPTWSLTCGIRYVERLQSNNRYAGGYCFNRKVAEQEYNGGSWVIRELARTKAKTLNSAKRFCYRARWACKENYEYPVRISKRQPKYSSMGGYGCN